jgi:hypothetical protein
VKSAIVGAGIHLVDWCAIGLENSMGGWGRGVDYGVGGLFGKGGDDGVEEGVVFFQLGYSSRHMLGRVFEVDLDNLWNFDFGWDQAGWVSD